MSKGLFLSVSQAPMIYLAQTVGSHNLLSTLYQVPVTFIYGENDWMRPQHAVELCEVCDAAAWGV